MAVATAFRATPDAGTLADALWIRYRALADQELAARDAAGPEKCRSKLQGALYVFVVDMIARMVDRVEREPDPCRRRDLIDALMGGTTGGSTGR